MQLATPVSNTSIIDNRVTQLRKGLPFSIHSLIILFYFLILRRILLKIRISLQLFGFSPNCDNKRNTTENGGCQLMPNMAWALAVSVCGRGVAALGDTEIKMSRLS